MNTDAETSKSAVTGPLPDLALALRAISLVSRWNMIKLLTCGEAIGIMELAEAGGCSYESAIKHLQVLLQAGLVQRGRGGGYQLVRQYLPKPGEPVVDFGHCLLRLDAGK
ncbi:MAG: hypothetical protein WCJ07_12815 [Verrucomicrobiota bacterium]